MNTEPARYQAEMAQMRAQRMLKDLGIRRSVINRIRELHGGGLDHYEVAKHTITLVETVKLVLRAGA